MIPGLLVVAALLWALGFLGQHFADIADTCGTGRHRVS